MRNEFDQYFGGLLAALRAAEVEQKKRYDGAIDIEDMAEATAVTIDARNKIKQWVERLSDIRDEIIADADASHTPKPSGQVIFHIRRQDMQSVANGIKIESGFRVLRGSYISKSVSPNMYEVVKRLRQENAKNIDANNHLLVDIDFDNAGQAARFVTGKQVNGIEEWRTDEGVSLKALGSETISGANAVTGGNQDELPNDDVFTNRKPKAVVLFGQEHSVTYWRDVLVCTCEVLFTKKPQVVRSFDSNKNLNKKRPTFSWHREAIKQQPERLSLGLWVELNHSAQTVMRICEKMLIECGFSPEDIQVTTQ